MSTTPLNSSLLLFRGFLYLLLLIISVSSCKTSKPYLAFPNDNTIIDTSPMEGIDHRIYLIGDAGGLDDKVNNTNTVIQSAIKKMKTDKAEKSVVFLGDNIYESGLGPENNPDRKLQETILQAQLDVEKESDAKLYFIPGNHDWNDNSVGGLAAIKRQYNYVKDNRINKDRVKFYPENGCGDPKVVKVRKDLVYFFIDSQWWVHDWESEPEMNKGCKIKSRREFLDRLNDMILEHRNDKIIFFLHHPMVSNGKHGGHHGLKDHAIPIIGSLATFYRQVGGSNQDNIYALHQEMRKSIEGLIRGYDVSQAIFVSGHDHILQHSVEKFIFQKSPIHFIVSGSGYKSDYSIKGNNARYVQSAKGYGVLSVYKDGSTWLDFFSVNKNGESKKEYRTQIYESKPGKIEFEKESLPADDLAVVTEAPNSTFGKSGLYRFFMGDQFRPSWTTPIKTSTFNLHDFYGGLTPIKKGGGLFSKTLRLEDEEGHQYALRSMNKDFFKAVPDNLQHLELMKLYADQNTASIPYGALYISELSKSADVYHTSPKVVYLDDPEKLGPFAEYFPKGHYLLEERPSGDWTGSELFGGSKEIIGFNDLCLLYTSPSPRDRG